MTLPARKIKLATLKTERFKREAREELSEVAEEAMLTGNATTTSVK